MRIEALIIGVIIIVAGLVAAIAYKSNREILIPEPTVVTNISSSVVYPLIIVTSTSIRTFPITSTFTEIQTVTSTSTRTFTRNSTTTLDTGIRMVEGGSRYIARIDVPVVSTLFVEFRAPDGYRFNVFLWDSTQYQLFVNQAQNVPSLARAIEQTSGTLTATVQPGIHYVNFKNNDEGVLGLSPKSHEIQWTIRNSYTSQVREPATIVQTQTVQKVRTAMSTVTYIVSSLTITTSTATSTVSFSITTTRTTYEAYLPYQIPGYVLVAIGILALVAGVLLRSQKSPLTADSHKANTQ